MSTQASGADSAARWRPALWAALAAALGVALWLSSLYSYLLFHTVAEVFSVVVACTVFLFSWSSRTSPRVGPFLVLGIGYLFVALIDLLHTLTYEGMMIFPGGNDYATKLWIAARGLQAFATLVFAVALRRGFSVPAAPAFAVFGLSAVFLVLSIFWWDIFPLCFVPGLGVTPFKKVAEYVICAVLLASAHLIGGKRGGELLVTRRLLVVALALNIASELVFTLYVSAYGYQNLIGHFLKIASFWMAYQALFALQIRARVALIGELEQSKAALEARERELRRANLSKDKFFSIIAHDLRSPIGGLLNVSELLAKRFDKLDPPTVRRLADSIYDATLQSAGLLESILHWARAHTGRLVPVPTTIRLAELCQGIVALNRAPADAKGIRIQSCVPVDAVATADEDMLATVVRNLVSNAVKFTRAGGEVTIGCAERNGWICLEVRDTGIGMTAEEVDRLFRIDAHIHRAGTASEPGNGLGLILCKELVALNHGEIEVSTQPEKGSVFTVCLPRD